MPWPHPNTSSRLRDLSDFFKLKLLDVFSKISLLLALVLCDFTFVFKSSTSLDGYCTGRDDGSAFPNSARQAYSKMLHMVTWSHLIKKNVTLFSYLSWFMYI